MTATNKYLKSSIGEISNFFSNKTEPPEDMYVNLLLELKVSNLLMPVVFDGENVSFPHIEVDDGTKLLPLFTSEDELKLYSSDFDWAANDIGYYIELVDDIGIDGILIDLGSDEFCIEKPLLDKISIPQIKRKNRGLSAMKLKELAQSVRNDELKMFIRNDSNFNNHEGISRLLKESILLNVIVSMEDLSPNARKGVICRNEADSFILFTQESGREDYGVVYTDVDAIIRHQKNPDYFYYAQVTNKFNVFSFMLSRDLDGLIINPGTDDYYVPRQVLLRLLDESLADADLENATRYAFVIE